MTSVSFKSVALFQRLSQAIKSGKSLETIKVMVALHPAVLEMVDGSGMTLLNYACSVIPPVQTVIIAYLILQSPKSVAMLPNSLGSCPLHFACQNKASLGIIQLLCKKHPDAIKLKNSYGYTPILYACEVSAPSNVIVHLVKEWQVSTLISSSGGKIPLDMVVNMNLELDAILFLRNETLAALCALIDVTLQPGVEGVPWPMICHVAEVCSDILPVVMCNEEIFCKLAIAKLELDMMRLILNNSALQSWLKEIKHQELVDGFIRMNSAGRSFLVIDPCNRLKDIAVIASTTSNTECVFLHLRSRQRNRFADTKFTKKTTVSPK